MSQPQGQHGWGDDDEPLLPLDPDRPLADDPFAARSRRAAAAHGRFHPRVVAAVAVGGAAGAPARYGVGLLLPTPADTFPWATFVVNVVGALLLAFILVVIADRLPPNPYWRPLFGTGFCGAFTTWSTLAVESDVLVMHHHLGLAAGYVAVTLAAGLAAAYAGLFAGRWVAGYGRA